MKDFKIKAKAEALEEPSAGELADGMPSLSGMGVTLADVKMALAAIDVAALKTQSLNRIKVKTWEEGDLVNGVDLRNHPNKEEGARIVKNLDAGGNIYLVFIDGGLVYNQWHIKNEGLSPITTTRLQEVVDEHIGEIAQTLLTKALRKEVLKRL